MLDQIIRFDTVAADQWIGEAIGKKENARARIMRISRVAVRMRGRRAIAVSVRRVTVRAMGRTVRRVTVRAWLLDLYSIRMGTTSHSSRITTYRSKAVTSATTAWLHNVEPHRSKR